MISKGQPLYGAKGTPSRGNIRPPRKIRQRKGKPYTGNRPARVIKPLPGFTGGGPAKPAPPAAPKPQGLPFDPVYQSTVSGLQRQNALTQADIQYQTGQVKQEFGFDDPSNPFSRAAMLQRAYQQGTAGRLNTAGNNLYGSSFTANENEARFGHEQKTDTARRSYAQALQALQQQGAQSTLDLQSGLSLAGAERIERAPRAEDPGLPPAPPAPQKRNAPAKPKGRKVKGKKGTPMKSSRKAKVLKRRVKYSRI